MPDGLFLSGSVSLVKAVDELTFCDVNVMMIFLTWVVTVLNNIKWFIKSKYSGV